MVDLTGSDPKSAETSGSKHNLLPPREPGAAQGGMAWVGYSLTLVLLVALNVLHVYFTYMDTTEGVVWGTQQAYFTYALNILAPVFMTVLIAFLMQRVSQTSSGIGRTTVLGILALTTGAVAAIEIAMGQNHVLKTFFDWISGPGLEEGQASSLLTDNNNSVLEYMLYFAVAVAAVFAARRLQDTILK